MLRWDSCLVPLDPRTRELPSVAASSRTSRHGLDHQRRAGPDGGPRRRVRVRGLHGRRRCAPVRAPVQADQANAGSGGFLAARLPGTAHSQLAANTVLVSSSGIPPAFLLSNNYRVRDDSSRNDDCDDELGKTTMIISGCS